MVPMKKLVITLILVLIATPAIAEERTWQESCQTTANLAEIVMTRRQEGVSIVEMVTIVKDMPIGSKERELTESILINAYGQPKFSTEEYIEEAITDFKNEVYLECAKSMR